MTFEPEERYQTNGRAAPASNPNSNLNRSMTFVEPEDRGGGAGVGGGAGAGGAIERGNGGIGRQHEDYAYRTEYHHSRSDSRFGDEKGVSVRQYQVDTSSFHVDPAGGAGGGY